MSFQYRGLKAVKKHHIVTDEEVQQQLEHLIATRPRRSEVADRATKNGDEVILDYAGFSEGVQFPGGTAQDQALVLGSGTFIPGFEEQLVGKNIGEEVLVDVKFPEQYHSEELAGKPAQFRCVIHEIHEMQSYELDDVFAKEVGQCETLQEMREKMGRSMQYYSEQESEMSLQDELLKQAAASLEMDITEKQLNDNIDEQLNDMAQELAAQGATLEMYCEFMNTTIEKLREEAVPTARANILAAATIDRIAELEKLEVTEDEMKEAKEQVCRSNNISLDLLASMNNPELNEMIARSVITGKVMALIRENAEITEE